jgi:hypothetical protein
MIILCVISDLEGALAATEINPEGSQSDVTVTNRVEISKKLSMSRPSTQDPTVTAGHESWQHLSGRHTVRGKCSIQKKNSQSI